MEQTPGSPNEDSSLPRQRRNFLRNSIYTAPILAIIQSTAALAEEGQGKLVTTLYDYEDYDYAAIALRDLDNDGELDLLDYPQTSSEPVYGLSAVDDGFGSALISTWADSNEQDGIVSVNPYNASSVPKLKFQIPDCTGLKSNLRAKTVSTTSINSGKLYVIETDSGEYKIYNALYGKNRFPGIFAADEEDAENLYGGTQNLTSKNNCFSLINLATDKEAKTYPICGDFAIDRKTDIIYVAGSGELNILPVNTGNLSSSQFEDPIPLQDAEGNGFSGVKIGLTRDYILMAGGRSFYVWDDTYQEYVEHGDCSVFRHSLDGEYIDNINLNDLLGYYIESCGTEDLSVQHDGKKAWLMAKENIYEIDLENFVFTGVVYPTNDDSSQDNAIAMTHVMDPESLNTDGDNYPYYQDCDDWNASIYPGAPDNCDGVDENCDGVDGEESNDYCGGEETPMATPTPERTEPPTENPDPTDRPDETAGLTPPVGEETDSDDETSDPGTDGEGTDSDEETGTPGAELTLPPWSTPTPTPPPTEEVREGCGGGCDTSGRQASGDALVLTALGISEIVRRRMSKSLK